MFVLWFIFWTVLIFVVLKLYVKLTTGWCRSQTCLKGKTVIVTGANTGIGFETALDLAKRGARVILACRNEERAKEARDKIIKESHNDDVLYKLVDFGSLASVRNFIAEIKTYEVRLDVLVNNAGAEDAGDKMSEDGFLFLMQVNYFAPVVLTESLLDMLKDTSGRIVNVSSIGAFFTRLTAKDLKNLNVYAGRRVEYIRTKLCNIFYTIQLASRLQGTGVTTYSLHPGLVYTDFLRSLPAVPRRMFEFFISTFFKSAIEGAQTSIYCAVANDIEQYNGQHFHDCHVVRKYFSASNPEISKQLWAETIKILKLE